MPEEYCINSYAKINLHLEVGNKREDGFHDIYSVFQMISLHDSITAIIYEKAGHDTPFPELIDIKGNFTCATKDNLMYRAAVRFMEETGLRYRIVFDVEKNIPEGAGLGGGSSNCAAVLRLLNRIFEYPLEEGNLSAIASETGSDVRFFMGDETTALVRGKGEIIEKVENPLPSYPLLLAYPGFKVETSKAYRWLDLENKRGRIPAAAVSLELSASTSEWNFYNSFRTILEKKYPLYREIFKIFDNTNAGYANITGSGSAVYGVYSSVNDMEKAKGLLSGFCPETWILDTLAGKPLLE